MCRVPGEAPSLAPCRQGTIVRIAVCIDRGICASSENGRVPLTEATVGVDGAFSATVDTSQFAFFLLYLEAEVDDGVSYRRLIRIDALMAGVIVLIDPSSEAAVRLMDGVGLQRFDREAVALVNQTVAQANAALDFSGDTPAQAASLATSNAAADTTVQAALDVPALPKPRTEGDGCQAGGAGAGFRGVLLLCGLLMFLGRLAGRPSRRSSRMP